MKYKRECEPIDIIDTQVHLGPSGYEESKFAMSCLGIRSVIIDELWLSHLAKMEIQPVEHPTDDCIRPISPSASLAAKLYPEQFGYMQRIELNDPDMDAIIRLLGKDPACKAFRVNLGMSPLAVHAFGAGAYEPLLNLIEATRKPVCFYLPDHPELLEKAAATHPDLTIIIDHMGLYSNDDRKTFHSPYQALSYQEACDLFDKILALSKYENICLKWSHASENFETPAFPGEPLWPLLRKAINAFGKDRILWASDFSVNQRGENWSELLYGMMTNHELSHEERKAIMGENAKRLFHW